MSLGLQGGGSWPLCYLRVWWSFYLCHIIRFMHYELIRISRLIPKYWCPEDFPWLDSNKIFFKCIIYALWISNNLSHFCICNLLGRHVLLFSACLTLLMERGSSISKFDNCKLDYEASMIEVQASL